MEKGRALTKAIELAITALAATEGKCYPSADYANSVADFIETLAKRLTEMPD